MKQLVASITFADSDVLYLLQAADMLAYGTNRKLRSAAPDYYTHLMKTPGRGQIQTANGGLVKTSMRRTARPGPERLHASSIQVAVLEPEIKNTSTWG